MSMYYVLAVALTVVISFLCGSIPFGVVIGKMFKGIDIREHGSGNTGTTNAIRILGFKLGITVFVLDVLKGVAGVLLSVAAAHLLEQMVAGAYIGSTILTTGWTFELLTVLAALFAMGGHIFSPFLGFHGGKGVATGLGVLLATIPLSGLLAFATFIVVLLIWRYASLGSIIAGFSLPVYTVLIYPGSIIYLMFSLAITVTLVITHRSNIRRLLDHEENRFEFHRTKGEPGGSADTL